MVISSDLLIRPSWMSRTRRQRTPLGTFGPVCTIPYEIGRCGSVRSDKQVFDWGVSEEIVPGRIAQDLHTVDGLRAGRTTARAPEPKCAVAVEAVNAIKPFVTKPVWGMIQFMLFTGCRPSECCGMKWSEKQSRYRWIVPPEIGTTRTSPVSCLHSPPSQFGF